MQRGVVPYLPGLVVKSCLAAALRELGVVVAIWGDGMDCSDGRREAARAYVCGGAVLLHLALVFLSKS